MSSINAHLAFLCIALCLTACKDKDKEEELTPLPTPPEPKMSTTYVDAQGQATTWSASVIKAELTEEGLTVRGSYPQAAETFTLRLSGRAVGEYPGAIIAFAEDIDEDPKIYTNTHDPNDWGIVSLTEVDTLARTVSGTFTYHLSDPTNPEAFIQSQPGQFGTFDDVPYETTVIGAGGLLRVDVDSLTKADPTAEGSVFDDNLNLSASFNGVAALTIAMPLNVPAGNYDLAESTNAMDITYVTIPGVFHSVSGEVTIGFHDPAARTVSGSFEALMTTTDGDSLEMTNGSFDISF